MTEFMVAARLHKIGGKLSIDHIREPTITDNEVLVEVKASGICHSDINYRNGIAPVARLPITLGHEIAGVITGRGARVRGLRHGDRVLVHYVISCGRCVYCKTGHENYCIRYRMVGKDVDGGFAEFVRLPARSIVKLPKGVPFEQAAIMGCAVPTAYHALRRGRVAPGNTVIVFGVGGLGLHAVQLARRVFKAGLVVAVDIHDWKLKLARSFGAKKTVNARSENVVENIGTITDGAFGDVVLDFVGHANTIEQAVSSVGMGGRMVVIGIGAKSMRLSPYRNLIGKEMEVMGVDDHLRTELEELIKLVRTRRIDLSRSVTHTVALEDVNRGLGILEANRENVIRVVAIPHAA
jgi:D-arabinose 1-dehydrogenase-like Zn-dependent alcohol dehydrogenase